MTVNRSSVAQQIKQARRVSTPLIAVTTADQGATARAIVGSFNGGAAPLVVQWDCVRGLTAMNKPAVDGLVDKGIEPGEFVHPVEALTMASQVAPRTLVVKGFDPKTFGQCEHTIRLQDATGDDYEIGLVRRADGKGWDALYDVYGPGRRLEERFGLGCGRLKKELGVEMAMQRARRRGYRVQRLTNARGQTQVRVWR